MYRPMLYVCPESDPICKSHETWHGGFSRVHSRSDNFWSTPVNRFRCATRDTQVPAIDKAHGAYYSCSRYCGNA